MEKFEIKLRKIKDNRLKELFIFTVILIALFYFTIESTLLFFILAVLGFLGNLIIRFTRKEAYEDILDLPFEDQRSGSFKLTLSESVEVQYTILEEKNHKGIYRIWKNIKGKKDYLYKINCIPRVKGIEEDDIFSSYYKESNNGIFLQRILRKEIDLNTELIWIDLIEMEIQIKKEIGFYKLKTSSKTNEIIGQNNSNQVVIEIKELE